jgi:hypothetical protein
VILPRVSGKIKMALLNERLCPKSWFASELTTGVEATRGTDLVEGRAVFQSSHNFGESSARFRHEPGWLNFKPNEPSMK